MIPRSSLAIALALVLLPGCSGGKDDGDTQDTAEEEVNEAPIVVDDAASVISGLSVEIDLTDNDDDPNDDDDILISEIVQPTNGIVEILNEDDVTYTSLNDYVGVDSFSYTVTDNGGLSDEANVTINVLPVPTLLITGPEEGASVLGPDIEITFEVDGCEMSSPSANADGCHVHKFLDDEEYRDEDDSAFGHYASDPFTISPIAVGSHTFKLVLVKNDGSDQPFEPEISDSVAFEAEAPLDCVP